MSYSFTIRAANKADLKTKADTELHHVQAQQPVHGRDRKQAYDAVCAFIDLLPDDKTKDYTVSVNGSISCSNEDTSMASVSVSAAITGRAP
jgi:hypothetical protein